MKERFYQLRELLSSLFQKLCFPMGGENEHMLAIYMCEWETHRLIATVTEKGYTLVTAGGATIHVNKIEDVESAFLAYFGRPDLAKNPNILGLDE